MARRKRAPLPKLQPQPKPDPLLDEIRHTASYTARVPIAMVEEANLPVTDAAATYRDPTPAVMARGPWLNVLEFGATGDGLHNDTEAVVLAIRSAGRQGGGTVYLPRGFKFLLWPFAITHSHVVLRVDGVVVCPGRLSMWGPLEMLPYMLRVEDVSAADRLLGRAGDPKSVARGESTRELQRMRLSFISLDGVDNVTICGSGTINGRGQAWWHIRRQRADVLAPVLLKMVRSTNVVVEGVRFINSPFYHVVAVSCQHLRLEGLYIHAPLASKNTDGINLMNSTDVVVRGCIVDTGDDNCAVKEGTRNVLVDTCEFRNGHGSSIGSIGEGGSYGEVRDVVMRNIVFNQTQNAARIKTWQGGTGMIRNITYTGLTVVDVVCPLLIEQFYCAKTQHSSRCQNSTFAVQVSDVTFSKIRGTQTSGAVGQFLCSDAVPCRNVTLENIEVAPSEPRPALEASKTIPWWHHPKGEPNNVFKCWNALGEARGAMSPESCLNTNSIGHGVIGPGVLSRSASIGLTTLESYFNMLLKQDPNYNKLKKKMEQKKLSKQACNVFTTIGAC